MSDAIDVGSQPTRIPGTRTVFIQTLAEECVQKNTIYEFSRSNAAMKLYVVAEVCRLCLSESGRKGVIIAPIVTKVREYLEVAEHQIPNVRSKSILGNAQVDLWEHEKWQEEMLTADLIVITPQVFFDALDARYVLLDLFSIMVIDECQHCKGSRPLAKIFSKHYTHVHGMRVLGVSTKLVDAKVTAVGGRTQAIRKMERLMDSRVHYSCVHDVHVAPDEVG
jgi:ERCC4-related helicase